MVNPTFDADAFVPHYAVDQRILIANFLETETADEVRARLDTAIFDFVFHLNGENRVESVANVRGWSTDQQRGLTRDLHREASKGVGFFYGGIRQERLRETPEAGEEILIGLLDELNGADVLEAVRTISGYDDIDNAWGQYTRFDPGHYLTRHKDDVGAESRRVAFVLGFSRDWHPDWGGLLQFYENDGTPRDAWAPSYNHLALFDVRHVHAVTYIAPFAASPRLSLTGWFRAGG